MKLVLHETESAALQRHIHDGDWSHWISSAVAEVEVPRAVRRVSSDAMEGERARTILSKLVLVEVSPAVRTLAATLEPPTLRALDAIHLATAVMMGAEIAAFVTYDRRLFAAALAAGLPAAAPGQPSA